MKKPIISHLYNEDPDHLEGAWHIQTNADHCEGTARLAAEFAKEFKMENWGIMLGLLHDRGKESEGFQAHIKRSSGYDPEAKSKFSSMHSHVGAILSHKIPVKDDLYWMSNAIAGHHRGLYDIEELEVVLGDEIPEEVSKTLPDIDLPLPQFRLNLEDSSHLTRMLFSCLVDADWLDTEMFLQPDKNELRGDFSSIPELKKRLDIYREKLKLLPSNDLNVIRSEIQEKCEKASALEPGFFSLTVPTGGGKTIASVVWAINHALKYNKKRIIIAIPFTSIITQTAEILRKIFGEENVIEHHSAVNESDIIRETGERSSLASENWDAPIIVTTNVQLFESMFSNKRSKCRKLHSLCNSIVILDEVQALPLTFLQPIVDAMKTYKKIFGTSFLFCTASQPILDGDRKGCNEAFFRGIDKKQIRDIIRPEMNLHDHFRRVDIKIDEHSYDYDGLIEKILGYKCVLCVVNTRKDAYEIFKRLPDDGVPSYHLSRYMCSSHILQIIDEIKKRLADPDVTARGIRVISTQLIEAGVDMDFPVVFRQLAGLDSILQAAGRCNREGKTSIGHTIVFSLKAERLSGSLRLAYETMSDLIHLNRNADWFSPEMMRLYYKKLYARTPYFDKEKIMDMLKNPRSCQFEESARKFKLINDEGVSIIVNFGESEKLVERLKTVGPSRKLSRQLGRYSVTVPTRMFEDFMKSGLIEEPFPGFYFIPLQSQYDNLSGLKTSNEYVEQTFII